MKDRLRSAIGAALAIWKLSDEKAVERREFYEERASWIHPGEEAFRMKLAAKMAMIMETRPRVLDIGCKNGRLREFLPSGIVYRGVDIVAKDDSAIIAVDLDRDALPFPDGCFEYVFAIEALEHLTEPHRILEEIRRVLMPGGACILSVPNPYHFKEVIWNLLHVPDRQGHLHSWTRQAMTTLVERAGFVVVSTRGTYLHPPIPWPRMWARSTMFRLRRAWPRTD